MTQSLPEAVKWYREAAERGFALAQTNLGMMYGDGSSVGKDMVEAYKWFSLGMAGGDANAANGKQLAASMLTPEKLAQAEKLVHEWKPKK
ncbi:tetratricopeptide repeat protein [Mariprofundus erugo]|uniref:tetratricopeptide repeat protein n=1 Tax=Mariprofundus erugo TaxID=2528639 RepID=UPI001386F8A6|nr:SEL1-like repeat protein [Mariprofundus erugo]